MNTLTIAWISLPFLIGFIIYLLPRLDKYLALAATIISLAYSLLLFSQSAPITLNLLDNYGVKLVADQLSAYFILTNALVTMAVIFYNWESSKTAFFYAQAIILHGSINSVFVCEDFISVYVALEVISIAAFLVIAYPRSDRSLWVALRYLFISNVAMLFYLIGAVLVYKANNSFAFAGLKDAPPEALALIFMGLLVKGGIFVSGLWLPMTHSESETSVSALMSGVVVKAGIFPLLRCALILEDLDGLIRLFGVLTAIFGVPYMIFEKDSKRMLAFSTIVQLGFILAAPVVSGFYTLTHGLVKSSLFLLAGVLPSRNFKELQQQSIPNSLWIAIVIASFSISGFPLLSGFGAKALTMKNLLPWQEVAINLAAVGTAIATAKFIFLPHAKVTTGRKLTLSGWLGIILLLTALFVANAVYFDAYNLGNISKALGIIAIGWGLYLGIFKKLSLQLSTAWEQFDNLVGMMAVILMLLFLSILAQLAPSFLAFS
ncbi:cation:proton antiporter [Microcystis aeruginosa]|uniref:NADH dehydrogenase subunit 4 n=2 Tax=Microcystis aeruginosa TaxID=1126 RepID=B0JH47_MICAN|nr:cation:proton antiporter [Microcystis aeruginosa]BAG02199.1 NADH dehydrogenase subunit 4 [Microcystis aeruginosa NIES-843]